MALRVLARDSPLGRLPNRRASFRSGEYTLSLLSWASVTPAVPIFSCRDCVTFWSSRRARFLMWVSGVKGLSACSKGSVALSIRPTGKFLHRPWWYCGRAVRGGTMWFCSCFRVCGVLWGRGGIRTGAVVTIGVLSSVLAVALYLSWGCGLFTADSDLESGVERCLALLLECRAACWARLRLVVGACLWAIFALLFFCIPASFLRERFPRTGGRQAGEGTPRRDV